MPAGEGSCIETPTNCWQLTGADGETLNAFVREIFSGSGSVGCVVTHVLGYIIYQELNLECGTFFFI